MKPAVLSPEIRMAIHVRAELLFDLVTEAESNASPEVIDKFLIEELEDMKIRLGKIYSAERVQSIIYELLVVYDAYKRCISPDKNGREIVLFVENWVRFVIRFAALRSSRQLSVSSSSAV